MTSNSSIKSPLGNLYLIPVNISDAPITDVIPQRVIEVVANIRHFIVENVRTARRFIRKCGRDIDIDAITFYELNNHTDPKLVSSFLNAARQGEDVGVMSEAGCPGVADPGALAVEVAQREGIRVIPLSGPSSILMSLMASGFNGQGFSFNGYLPIESSAKVKKIRELEALALRTGMTQIFIETPYRNNRMVQLLAETLHPNTPLCVAVAITDPEQESIKTMPASQWKKAKYDYAKIPAIFLIGRPQ